MEPQSPREAARDIRDSIRDSMESAQEASFEHAEQIREMVMQAEIHEAQAKHEEQILESVMAHGEIAVFGRRTVGSSLFSAGVEPSRWSPNLVAPDGPGVSIRRLVELAQEKDVLPGDFSGPEPDTELNAVIGDLARTLGVNIRKYRWDGDGDISCSYESGVLAHSNGEVEGYQL